MSSVPCLSILHHYVRTYAKEQLQIYTLFNYNAHFSSNFLTENFE